MKLHRERCARRPHRRVRRERRRGDVRDREGRQARGGGARRPKGLTPCRRRARAGAHRRGPPRRQGDGAHDAQRSARSFVLRPAVVSNLDALEAAGVALRWARHLFPPRTPEPEGWHVLVGAPRRVSTRGRTRRTVHLARAGLALLAAVGYALDLERCVACGRPAPRVDAACIDPATRGPRLPRVRGRRARCSTRAARRAARALLEGGPRPRRRRGSAGASSASWTARWRRTPASSAKDAAGMEVVCFGEILWDLFERGPRADGIARDFRRELGGAPANVATGLARLGVKVRDRGRRRARSLRRGPGRRLATRRRRTDASSGSCRSAPASPSSPATRRASRRFSSTATNRPTSRSARPT